MSALVECVVDWQRAEVAAVADLDAHGRSVARGVARKVPDLIVLRDYLALEDHVEDIVRTEEGVTAASIVRADGVVVASFPRGTTPADWPGGVFVEQAISAGHGGAAIAKVQLALSRLPMERRLRERAIRLLSGSALSAMAIGVALWFALRRTVVQPLRELDAEAQRLGRGEFDRPLHDQGSTEIGRLGRTLDEMRKNLARSHADIAEQNRRLQELDRLKSQFLANMSHEMRTPLTSILGEAELLTEHEPEGTVAGVATRAIHRNGVRLLELVDRLLDLAKVESGKLLLEHRPCRPDRIVLDTCARYRDEARRRGLDLRVDVTALAATTVATDAVHVAQMVANLVDNGVKFTERGSVAVTADWCGDGPQRRLRIVVADTGIGIPARFL
ncbi:MAG: HAMP domain-containing protein, partial [Planctomycetes bacterium]|nr:HAMP domain-containing protein [Planctomycetota bacterium]